MDGKPKAKQPARRNPVARREQNRLASRNYREKRKQKLALLGQLLDTESPESQQPSSSAAQDDDVAAGPAVVGVAPGAFLAAGNDTAEGEVVAPGDRSTTGWTWQSASNNVAAILGPEALAAWKLCNSNEQLHNKPDSRPDASRDGHAGPGMPPGESSLSSNQDDLIISVLSSVKSLSQKQKRDLIRHLGHLVNESPDTTTSSSSTTNNHDAQLPPKSWVSTASRGAAAPAAGTRLQVEARRFADFIDRCSRAVAGGHNPVSLVRNYSLQTGYFGAIFANCFALGMSNVEPMMEEEGVSLFSLGPETGYHQSQLGAVRPKFHSITPDLRPSDLQLVRGHHPYLDVVPFQGFRDRALKFLYSDVSLMDEAELCMDFCNGGLVCWGSQSSNLGMEAGVPWDKRSWEPQVWFLKKYWFLVGDWYDEMWERARWWHNVRGEKIQVE